MPMGDLEAARAALKRGQYKQCIDICCQGVCDAQARGNETDMWWFRCLSAQSLGMQGRFREALNTVDTENPGEHLEARVRILVLAQRAFYLERIGEYAPAKNLLEQAAKIDCAQPNEELLAEVQLNRMTLFFYLADYDAMEDCARAALVVAQRQLLATIEAGACSGIAKSLMVRGRFQEAIRWYERARMFFTAEGLSVDAIRMGSDLGCCYLGLDELDKAMQLFSEALQCAEASGASACMHHDHANIGCVYLKRGEYGAALSHFQKALEIARDLGDRISIGKWLNNLSLAYERMGDSVQAMTCKVEAELVNQQVTQARTAAE